MPTIISETEMPVPTPTSFLMQGVCLDMDDVVKKPDGVASQEIKKEKDLHGQRV
ncbi:MAG TPA: hypothetical protein GXZ66_02090 [Clostridiaceae bacterium]|jgi:uncharacterized membrane protein|nr:hypothetical protein [Clostridiaceae bacterium]